MTLSITRNKLFSPFRGLKSTTEQELAAVALKAIGNIVSVMSLLDLWKKERMKNNNNNNNNYYYYYNDYYYYYNSNNNNKNNNNNNGKNTV